MSKVSIIIPCPKIGEFAKKCISECLKLDYSDFEILVLPDEIDKKEIKKYLEKVKIIPTGKVNPGLKRNIGMKKAQGDFFAFIDDDAYPKKDWLKNAIKYFKDKKVGVVGGPNLTPPKANEWERISGKVYSNFLASGFASIRYKISKNKFVKELPSCNYISRKEVSPEYHPDYLTAEDSKFCFDIAEKGFKILYAGNVIVYHHRRNSLKKHLIQAFIYGRDIAWLSREKFSLDKFYYSILSLFVIGFFAGDLLTIVNTTLLISGNFSLFLNWLNVIFLILVGVYIISMFLTNIHESLKVTIKTAFTSILTHFYYGFGYLNGIFRYKKNQ